MREGYAPGPVNYGAVVESATASDGWYAQTGAQPYVREALGPVGALEGTVTEPTETSRPVFGGEDDEYNHGVIRAMGENVQAREAAGEDAAGLRADYEGQLQIQTVWDELNRDGGEHNQPGSLEALMHKGGRPEVDAYLGLRNGLDNHGLDMGPEDYNDTYRQMLTARYPVDPTAR